MRKAPQIRRAEPADLNALEQLEDRVFPVDALSRRSLRYYIGASTASFLVLLDSDEIIGDAIVAFRRGSEVARLYSLAVAPDVAGRGFGRMLLAACETAARERGSRILRLEVRADNVGAIRLYETAGYKRFGSYPDYYEDGARAERYERSLLDRPPP